MAVIRNIGRTAQAVGVITAEGKKAYIRVMPRNPKGVTLPEGATLDPNWMALNGKYIREFDDSVLAKKSTTSTTNADSTSTASTTSTATTAATTATSATDKSEA